MRFLKHGMTNAFIGLIIAVIIAGCQQQPAGDSQTKLKADSMRPALAAGSQAKPAAAPPATAIGKAGVMMGTADALIEHISSNAAHKVQCWQVLPDLAQPGRYRLSMQHAAAGEKGAFFLTAWTDTTGNGMPDREIGRSDLKVAAKAGDWSNWEFDSTGNSIYVGNCWKNTSPSFFFVKNGPTPKGYFGLGTTVFHGKKFGAPPLETARRRFTNIRLQHMSRAK